MDSFCPRPIPGEGLRATLWMPVACAGVVLVCQLPPAEARAETSGEQTPRVLEARQEPVAPPRGEDSAKRVAHYSAPQHCPNQAEFVVEVLARSDPANRTGALAMLHECSVTISVDDTVAQGTLALPTGELRKVVGTSCTEVAQALALVVAIQAKDDHTRPADTSSPASAVVDTPPPRALPSPTALVVEPATQATASASSSRPANARTVVSSLRLSARRFSVVASHRDLKAHWAVGVGAVESFGPAPMGLFGGSMFLDYWKPARLPYGLVVALEGTAKTTHTVEEASAAFQFWASRFDACLNPLSSKGQLRLWLCAEGLLGVTTVQGRLGGPITRKGSAIEGWYSMGPAARLAWSLTNHVRMELVASLTAPFVRHSTKFSAPDIKAAETGPLAGSLSLRIGYEAGGSDPAPSAIAQ